jgi:dihydrofolate reductase
MAKVILEMSMSLDGFTTGPDVSEEEPMGRGGERLHEWMFEGRSDEEAERFQVEKFEDVRAVIVGRRMADLGIVHWGDEPPFHCQVFVVTNRPAATIEKTGGTSYTYVTGGVDEALHRARDAAAESDIVVGGGADIGRQYLAAGAVDEVRLHLVPVILGGDARLFDGPSPNISMRPIEVTGTPSVTHLTYEVTRPADRS